MTRSLIKVIITPRLKLGLEFKLEDLWIGAFWRTGITEVRAGTVVGYVKVWICLLPCLPFVITWSRPK